VRVNQRLITVTELRMMIRLLGGDEQALGAYVGKYTLDKSGKLHRVGGAYLGNLARAAEKARAGRASGAPPGCAWLELGAPRGVLGQAVTVACD
jgi:hypothetical protein